MKLSSRLSAYSAIAFGYLISNDASAQTFCHDYTPNAYIEVWGDVNEHLHLDLDFDGTNDLNFNVEYESIGSSSSFYLTFSGAVEFVLDPADNRPQLLPEGVRLLTQVV